MGTSIEKGPEDDPGWKKVFEKAPHPSITICRSCKATIVAWHCADFGCPWCRQCGSTTKDVREKRKDGTD